MKKISALAVAGVFVASLAGTVFAEGTDVKVSGEIRIRDEWKNNFNDFDSSSSSGGKEPTNAITQRTRVNVDAKVDERTKAYVSLENNRNFGSSGSVGATTADSTVVGTNNGTLATSHNNGSDTVSLYQGYVVVDKLFDQPLLFKAGRQKIALGNQRLVGANDWGAGQAFDGWILGYSQEAVAANLFSVTLSDTNATTTNENAALNGIYLTVKSVPVTGIDVYAMQYNGGGGTGTLFNTYGVRANGAAMNIDWDAEFALQSGDSSKTGTTTTKKDASAIWVVAGYSLPQVSKLRVGVEYDQLSGSPSSSATNPDDKSFALIAPTYHSNSLQHSNYGINDIVEKYSGTTTATAYQKGLKAFSINASAQPIEGLSLLAEYWNFSSSEEYATTIGNNKSTSLGNEINLQVWYAITKSTGLHAYYAQYTPGDQKTKTVSGVTSIASDAATDAVLQLQVAF